MSTATIEVADPLQPEQTDSVVVTLVDGSYQDLSRLSVEQLFQLQWEQETAFARLIKNSEKGTQQRADTIQWAYETVCAILSTISETEEQSDFTMGMDQRYTKLVIERLTDLQRNGIDGGLFELGFGTGVLLQAAAQAGVRVGGLEVADQLYAEAKARLPEGQRDDLCIGDFLNNAKIDALTGQFSVIYWNDVFEHIPVDEIEDYLQKIHDLLLPGGELITITPNWHMRPMDVTADHLPPRSTAIGFHLKEYTLAEVCELLEKTGFAQIHTPDFVGKTVIVQNRIPGATWLKRKLEPALEWLPHAWAVQCCRRFGYCCTIAKKTGS